MGICPFPIKKSRPQADIGNGADGLQISMLDSYKKLAVNLSSSNDAQFLYFIPEWELELLIGQAVENRESLLAA